MNPVRPVSTLVASSFLGVIAVASIVVGALMFFGARATQVELVGPVSTAFGVFAAVAARDEREARPTCSA